MSYLASLDEQYSQLKAAEQKSINSTLIKRMWYYAYMFFISMNYGWSKIGRYSERVILGSSNEFYKLILS